VEVLVVRSVYLSNWSDNQYTNALGTS
jgi:hypothetical protein